MILSASNIMINSFLILLRNKMEWSKSHAINIQMSNLFPTHLFPSNISQNI